MNLALNTGAQGSFARSLDMGNLANSIKLLKKQRKRVKTVNKRFWTISPTWAIWFLLREGFVPINIKFMDREKYYEAFLEKNAWKIGVDDAKK